ncbi:unnamed protein product [Chrysoparadoxa australica]
MGLWPSKKVHLSGPKTEHSRSVWRKEAGHHGEAKDAWLIPKWHAAPSECLELLDMLNTPVGQHHLGAYARQTHTQELLFIWADLSEFRTIPSKDFMLKKAKQIYHKYVSTKAMQTLTFIPTGLRNYVANKIFVAEGDLNAMDQDFLAQLMQSTLLEIHKTIYSAFRLEEDRYNAYVSDLRENYNQIREGDFEYFEKLGEGAFGVVVRCRKKSTGEDLAMKIQIKTALIKSMHGQASKLDNERRIFAACNHPFILQMKYAFTTPQHAIIVTNLVPTGTLQDAIDTSPDKRLSHERARLYTAEISLALHHLHDLGLIYRDLKPRNVMLGPDGHIQLADMGGVGDGAGNITRGQNQAVKAETISRRRTFRRRSIMGTQGYMAPEMVRLMGNQQANQSIGYSAAVDWWSLGVTCYKMLTGARPFEMAPRSRLKKLAGRSRSNTDELAKVTAPVHYPDYLENDAVNLLRALLAHNEKDRLGSGPKGWEHLKEHAFFKGLDWDRLSDKLIPAPFIPEMPENSYSDSDEGTTYAHMIKLLEDHERMKITHRKHFNSEPSAEQQKLFLNWHYINASTLKLEMGIGNEMEALHTSYKAQQLMGPSQGSPDSQRWS